MWLLAVRIGVRSATRRVISPNAPSIWALSRCWKIAISASEATGPSRSTACSISGQRSAGMSACANGFQTSCTNSSTNERETESQWRSMSSRTASALRSEIPRATTSSATASSDGLGDPEAAVAERDEHAEPLGLGRAPPAPPGR